MRLVQNEQRPAATGRSGGVCLDESPDNDAAPLPVVQVPEFLTRRQAAAVLQVSLATFDRLKVPRHLVGCSPRFLLDELRDWVRAQGAL